MGWLVIGVWRCVAVVCCAVLWRSVVWRLCAAVMCVAAVLVCRWAPFVVFLIVAHLFVCVCVCVCVVLLSGAVFGRLRLLRSGLVFVFITFFVVVLVSGGGVCSDLV